MGPYKLTGPARANTRSKISHSQSRRTKNWTTRVFSPFILFAVHISFVRCLIHRQCTLVHRRRVPPSWPLLPWFVLSLCCVRRALKTAPCNLPLCGLSCCPSNSHISPYEASEHVLHTPNLHPHDQCIVRGSSGLSLGLPPLPLLYRRLSSSFHISHLAYTGAGRGVFIAPQIPFLK